MEERVFYSVTAVIFAVIAALHFARMTFAWEVKIGGWIVPTWISGLAVLIGIYMMYQSIRMRKRLGDKNNHQPL